MDGGSIGAGHRGRGELEVVFGCSSPQLWLAVFGYGDRIKSTIEIAIIWGLPGCANLNMAGYRFPRQHVRFRRRSRPGQG